MKLEDLVVEVRNKSLSRVGRIAPEDLDIEVYPEFNNVGAWKLSLPVEHPLAESLRTPGAGLIISSTEDVILSGPMVSTEYAQSPEDPGGTIDFAGIGDTHILADYVCFPQPSNASVSTQTLAHDEQTGNAETLMHGYVDRNIGPSAPAARRKPRLKMGTNGGRGLTFTKKARFQVVGEWLSEIAANAFTNPTSDVQSSQTLGFRIVQRDDMLVFETFLPSDRSAELRLSQNNRQLSGSKTNVATPGATRVLIGGQGELEDRQFSEINDARSLEAEALWGRRIERFVDQRQTDDLTEHAKKGAEILSEEGFTAVNVQAIPADDTSLRFAKDWYLGDLVTIEIQGREMVSRVAGMVLKASSDGFYQGIVLGDSTAFSPEAATASRLNNIEQRVGALELADTPTVQVLMPVARWNGSLGKGTNLPNNGAIYTTHVLSTAAVPANAVTAQVTFTCHAQVAANAAVHWYGAINNGQGAYVNGPQDVYNHNEGNTALDVGPAFTMTVDCRYHAKTGQSLQLVLNGSNDAGSGAWVHVGNLNVAVTYFGLTTL